MNNTVAMSNVVKESEYGKILLSDVVITRNRNLLWGRKWRTMDVQMMFFILAIHSLALFAPFTFTWGAFWSAFWTYVCCGIFGVTLSYHRNLAHRSLKLPKWLEYFFAYLGVLSFQYQERNNVEDLKSQVFYRFIRRTYVWHKFVFAALVYALGGFSYFVWTVGVATTWGYHVTFLVNSACHIWGNQSWDTNDLSKNNWWVAIVTFGEGWHNNHHAFEYSARHGLEWWQIDYCWYTIKFLEALGLATNVKLPTEEHKAKKSINKYK
ncbi:palmitoyl-monogalactosyldiacylglycerol delta-7 desaturase, chloroplastic-like protein [Tanacetum coccineum]